MKLFSICILLGVLASCSSYDPNPCPGAQDCGDGTCAPLNSVCCGNGTSCPHGTVCANAINSCVDSRVAACVSNGEEACENSDGTIDCAPFGAACCGNHKWCPVGRVCVNGGTACQ